VFVLATVCDGHPRGQALCYQANLLGSLLRWLQLLLPGLAALEAQQTAAAAAGGGGGAAAGGGGVPRGAALLVKWCCLALGRLVEDAPEAAAVSGAGRGQGGGHAKGSTACVSPSAGAA
jgi:regulator-associated protein of mTOR